MIDSVRNAFALPDLRRRILYTLLILVIYRLAANIPVPGVDLSAWLAFTTGQGGSNNLLDFLDLLSGGAVRNFSVMAMGVYPYITASIIIQLLTPIVPQLEELAALGLPSQFHAADVVAVENISCAGAPNETCQRVAFELTSGPDVGPKTRRSPCPHVE